MTNAATYVYLHRFGKLSPELLRWQLQSTFISAGSDSFPLRLPLINPGKKQQESTGRNLHLQKALISN
jgi:hypothetical protein